MSALGRVFFGSRGPALNETPEVIVTRTSAATAVAGYVRRATLAERFFLASRLASVARLNTPHGRIPRIERRPRATPPIPADRIGAKKRRMPANGLRVLTTIEARRTTAQIIPFPADRKPTAVQAMKKAA